MPEARRGLPAESAAGLTAWEEKLLRQGGDNPVQPIAQEELDPILAGFAGRDVYLHLETTAGAYTAGGFGAFARNMRVQLRRGAVRGAPGKWRAGLETADGWIYAEGLTHWELDDQDRLLMAGYDGEGRVTVVCELSAAPWPMRPEVRRIAVAVPPRSGPPTTAPTAERSVLVVLAHPDDETFGMGGTIALYTQAGIPVTCAIGTRGEMGRNMGKPFFATRETLYQLRERELAAACAALGVPDLRLLGCWDKTTEFQDPAALAARVGELLRELRPSLVCTSHPVHGGHPDHCATGAAAVAAVRALPAAERPRVHCLMGPQAAQSLGLPLIEVDIRPVRALKEAAVHAHRTQSEAMLQRAKPEDIERRFLTERFAVYPL